MGLPGAERQASGASLVSAADRMKEDRARDVERSRAAHVAGMEMTQLERDVYHAHRRAVQSENRERAFYYGMTLVHAPGLNGSYGPYQIDWVADELRVMREMERAS